MKGFYNNNQERKNKRDGGDSGTRTHTHEARDFKSPSSANSDISPITCLKDFAISQPCNIIISNFLKKIKFHNLHQNIQHLLEPRTQQDQ